MYEFIFEENSTYPFSTSYPSQLWAKGKQQWISQHGALQLQTLKYRFFIQSVRRACSSCPHPAAHPRMPGWNSQLTTSVCMAASPYSLVHRLRLHLPSCHTSYLFAEEGWRADILLLPASSSLVQLSPCLDEQVEIFVSNIHSWGQAGDTGDSAVFGLRHLPYLFMENSIFN